MNNSTIFHNESVSTEIKTRSKVYNVVVILSGTIVVLCHMTAIWMLAKCKRLPSQIVYTSLSVLVSELLSACSLIVNQSLINLFGIDTPLMQNLQFTLTFTLVVVSMAAVTRVAVDRMVAVVFPLYYKVHMTSDVVKGLVTLDWVIPVATTSLTWAYVVATDKNLCPPETHYLICSQKPRRVLYVLQIIYIILFATAQIVTIAKIKGKEPSSTRRQRQYGEITTVLQRITLVYFILHVPYFGHSVTIEAYPDSIRADWRKGFHAVVYMCSCVCSLWNSHDFVWRIKECRYIFIAKFLRRIPRLNREMVRLYIELYRVLPYQRNEETCPREADTRF